MSSISSISCSSLASYSSVKNTQKSDSSSLVDKLFNKLDTKQQGYVDKDELQAALTSATSNASGTTSTSADDLFAKMDADGDGKITKQEMGNTLQSLMDQVDNMAAKMRVQGSAGRGQAPGDDKGFTKDELVQMAQDTSETDSKRSAFMSNLADNFDKADTDGDGKVTRDEAMSYAKSTGQEMGGPSGAQGPSGGMPPPPPSGAGGGGSATADSGTTSSSTSTDPADTNGDGTVSAQEALTYLLAQLSTDESSSTTDSSSTADSTGFSDKIARQIMQLVQAYGTSNSAANDEDSSISSSLSVSA